jgi:hypothetical protein
MSNFIIRQEAPRPWLRTTSGRYASARELSSWARWRAGLEACLSGSISGGAASPTTEFERRKIGRPSR